MGLFDYLFDSEKKEERKYAKFQKTLTHMYVQPSERAYLIEQLRELRTPEACRVLLKRFAESAPNSTVDLEEKERVYEVLTEFGAETDFSVVEIVKEHLKHTDEAVNWPIKVLTDLLSYEEFIDFTVDLLADCSPEYKQNPEKKQELMLRSQELKSPKLTPQLVRFLEDHNETVRFLAVEAVTSQNEPEVTVAPLAQMLVVEESLRIVQKLAEAFVANQDWKIPEELVEEVAEALPEGYGVHAQRHIYKRR